MKCTNSWRLTQSEITILSLATMDVSFTLDKLRKETLRWPRGQDKITSRCVHVLGFVYRKQEEMPARVVVPSSCHRARGTAACAWTHGVCCRKILLKMTRYLSLLYFSHVEKVSYSSKHVLYFINYLCFFLTFHHVRLTNNSGAETAQYGLEINFKALKCRDCLPYEFYHGKRENLLLTLLKFL